MLLSTRQAKAKRRVRDILGLWRTTRSIDTLLRRLALTCSIISTEIRLNRMQYLHRT